jgi:hypothetical protein
LARACRLVHIPRSAGPAPGIHRSRGVLVNQHDGLIWAKSQFCNNTACVEVAKHDDGVLIRDSKNPRGPKLQFTNSEWDAFVEGVRRGEFDGLGERPSG